MVVFERKTKKLPVGGERLDALLSLIEEIELKHLVERGLDCEANRDECKTRAIGGSKYTKVDIGRSGAYMIDNATGAIYGIKAYGVIKRGSQFGTLEAPDVEKLTRGRWPK